MHSPETGPLKDSDLSVDSRILPFPCPLASHQQGFSAVTVCASQTLSCVRLFVAPWAVAHQEPTRLICPWNFPGKHTGVGCHFLLQGIFPTQVLNLCLLYLLHWQVDSLQLVPQWVTAKRAESHRVSQRKSLQGSSKLRESKETGIYIYSKKKNPKPKTRSQLLAG